MPLLRTGVSKAFWCSPHAEGYDFQPAQGRNDPETAQGETHVTSLSGPALSWLDELLGGGIELPEAGTQPLSILISGPPGSGKTTLALELCYRLAKKGDGLNEEELFSVYISPEVEPSRLVSQALKFGWESDQDALDRYVVSVEDSAQLAKFVASIEKQQQERQKSGSNRFGAVAIWGAAELRRSMKLAELVQSALELVVGVFSKHPDLLSSLFRRPKVNVEKFFPDVVVIDSLNVIQPELQADFFQQFLATASQATKLIVFVLDSGSDPKEHDFWEYVCDFVLRLDHHTNKDYYLRTLEIVKARFQAHVWGEHQLKIYPGFRMPTYHDHQDSEHGARQHARNIQIHRAHPYRKEGGIFIFPSIHYYLSRYKRSSSTEPPQRVDTVPESLNAVVNLPRGRCTALIGRRGAHKSHLAYLHLLHRLKSNEECALIISLRDDEEMTKQTMAKILVQEFRGRSGPDLDAARNELTAMERLNRFEILYYNPGYITPEEFFHRMFLSIHRLKKSTRPVTVVFNSLDQLSARFPLCAQQQIFIPGIIEMLNGEDITSIFIAVDEPGQPGEQYGLLPMADLILSFYPYRFKFDDYAGHLESGRSPPSDDAYLAKVGKIKTDTNMDSERQEVVLEVVRFAGGQRAGMKGILELVDEGELSNSLHENVGLKFIRLSSRFDAGRLVQPGMT